MLEILKSISTIEILQKSLLSHLLKHINDLVVSTHVRYFNCIVSDYCETYFKISQFKSHKFPIVSPFDCKKLV